ncbi:MAG TPA: lamin tail domain-containing protein, partial [Pirellulaceae bacterium]
MLSKKLRQLILGVTACAMVYVANPAGAQLQITEVMVNSVVEGTWEWIEVRNPTGSAIDLNNWVLDDDDNNALTMPNIVGTGSGGMATTTMIPANGVGVLYNGTALGFNNQRFRNAWQLGANVPLVAIAGPPDLGNTGDHFGLWNSLASYNMDVADTDMDGDFEVFQFSNSQASIDYTSGFPAGTDRSLYWNGTGAFSNGANWSAST